MASVVNPDIYKIDLIKQASQKSDTFSDAIYEEVGFDPYAVDRLSVIEADKNIVVDKLQKKPESGAEKNESETQPAQKPGESLNRESIKAQLKNLIEEKKEEDLQEPSESSDQKLDSFFELSSRLPKLEETAFSYKFKDKSETIKVLFVFEKMISSTPCEDDLGGTSLVLQAESKIIFEKITKAMQLENKDFLISWLSSDNENPLENVLEEIFAYQPKVVVSIGSLSTQLLTRKTTHFTQIRMNKYILHVSKNGKEVSMPLLPLFNIELLSVNQRLKKIAWDDLQSIMPFYHN